MKKNIIILLFGLMCLSFTPNKIVSIKGQIIASGNDPYIVPVLQAKNKKTYHLKSDTFDIKELLNEQGKDIEVTGILQKLEYKETDVFVIDVQSYELIIK